MSCGAAAELMLAKRKELIFSGDYNMDMYNGHGGDTALHQALSNFCDQFCLTNMNTEPTQVTAHSKTLLDVILSSHPDRFAYCGNSKLEISDRDLVYAVHKQKIPRPRIIEYRSLANLDQDAHISDLKLVPCAFIFDNVDDVSSHWAALFQEVKDKQVPAERNRLWFKQLPWIEAGI